MTSIHISSINQSYMWLDPASGKRDNKVKATRARSAIVVLGTDPVGRVFVLDTWADRVGTSAIVDAFLTLYERWRPGVAAYEDMGQQALLEDPLREEADKRELPVPLVPVKVTTRVDKNWRIRTMIQPLLAKGMLFLDESFTELYNELKYFPMSQTVDLVDALACCCSLLPPAPSIAQHRQSRKDLEDYLRESGVSNYEMRDMLNSFDEGSEDYHLEVLTENMFSRER